jgi:hypothetical protein
MGWAIALAILVWALTVYVILCHRVGVLVHEVQTYAELVQLLRQEVEEMKNPPRTPSNSNRAKQWLK